MRPLFLAAAAAVFIATACSPSGGDTPSAPERAAIADSLKHLVTNTYDLSKPDVVGRLMSLYPTEGEVISANTGSATTTRAALNRRRVDGGVRQSRRPVGDHPGAPFRRAGSTNDDANVLTTPVTPQARWQSRPPTC